MTDPADPREELLELTRHTRAWVEWLRDSGLEEDSLPNDPMVLRGGPKPARGAPAPRVQAPRAQAVSAQAQAPAAPAPAAPQRAAPQPAAAPPPAIPSFGAPAPKASAPAAVARASWGADVPDDPAERKRRLDVLAEEVSNCTKCRLHESRTRTAFARGSHEAEVVFVGEGPGAEEDRQGLPFVGPAGQLLDKMIGAMGYQRDEVYIANIVKCRPPKNRKPEPDEITACTPYLEQQLALVNPKVMVALGATGVQGLLGTSMGITRMRGSWKLYRGRIPLMPTFHPAYLLRQASKKRDVWNDLQQVMARLGKEPPPKKPRGDGAG